MSYDLGVIIVNKLVNLHRGKKSIDRCHQCKLWSFSSYSENRSGSTASCGSPRQSTDSTCHYIIWENKLKCQHEYILKYNESFLQWGSTWDGHIEYWSYRIDVTCSEGVTHQTWIILSQDVFVAFILVNFEKINGPRKIQAYLVELEVDLWSEFQSPSTRRDLARP
jgi:hypothetical protein